jgi:RNA polymerase sigma factor (TIGR02999 family)
MPEPTSLTDLLHRAHSGDAAALRAVFDALYDELRTIARSRLSRGGRGTLLDTTSLVHESFMRFARLGRVRPEDRDQFLRYSSQVMRSVIVDFVRERLAARRGADATHLTLNSEILDPGTTGEDEIVRVHEALEELAHNDARMAQVVEMRYFGGMTEPEIAAALGVTDRTVRRDWEKARLLLAAALRT